MAWTRRRQFLAAGVASAGAVAGCLDVLGSADSWDGTVDGTEWPMRGRTAATTRANPAASVPTEDVEREWLVDGDRPRIAAGELVVVDEAGDGRVVAYDRTTGEDERTVWDGPVDDVALADGTAYLATFDERSVTVRAVDVATGREGWQVDSTELEVAVYPTPQGFARTFCVTGERVYLLPRFVGWRHDMRRTDFGPLLAIDRADGAIAWEEGDVIDLAVAGERVVTLEETDGGPALSVRRRPDGEAIEVVEDGIPAVGWVIDSGVGVADGVAYVVGEDGRVVGVDIEDGSVVGDHDVGRFPRGLAVGPDRVYVAGFDRIDAYERPLGDRVWSFDVPDYSSGSSIRGGPTVTANAVLFTVPGNRLFALDPATGDRLWLADVSSEDVPKAVDERVYLSTPDGVAAYR